MRRKTVGLYTPYLDVMGGGEKHILSILKVFDEVGYNIIVHWDTDLSKEIHDTFKLSFDHLSFQPSLTTMSFLDKAKRIPTYEWFFYVTDGSYFFSPAKHTAIFCMVPKKSLYKMGPVNSLKTANSTFISNSLFTKKKLYEWGVQSSVVYPYITQDLFVPEHTPKKKQILSVGRFFKHLHSKKHASLIDAFLLFRKKHPEFELVIAGGVKEQDVNYVNELVNTYRYPYIHIKTNVPFAQLRQLYKESLMYWHFTGIDENEQTEPEKVEHLGITPIEAMAARSIPFCFSAGGPRELIEQEKNGFLFHSVQELALQSHRFVESPSLQVKMQTNAYGFAFNMFRYETFRKRVLETFHVRP